MQHQQQQKGVDSAHQKLPLYIVPSCGYHIDVVILWKGSQQSIYSLCKSGGAIKEISLAISKVLKMKRTEIKDTLQKCIKKLHKCNFL